MHHNLVQSIRRLVREFSNNLCFGNGRMEFLFKKAHQVGDTKGQHNKRLPLNENLYTEFVSTKFHFLVLLLLFVHVKINGCCSIGHDAAWPINNSNNNHRTQKYPN